MTRDKAIGVFWATSLITLIGGGLVGGLIYSIISDSSKRDADEKALCAPINAKMIDRVYVGSDRRTVAVCQTEDGTLSLSATK